MNVRKVLLLLCVALSFLSCEREKKQLMFVDDDVLEDSLSVNDEAFPQAEVSYESGNEISIPFREEGGVKLIPVKINGQFTVDMILDSGCSGTLISISEAKYLYEKGCFSEEDVLGVSHSQIADGSIVENMVINLRELIIGDAISCTNVTATVSANATAPLLLGNEVLNRAPAYKVDNVQKLIIFKLP